MKIIYFTQDYSVHDHRFLTTLASKKNEVFLLRLEAKQPLAGLLPKGVDEIVWRPFGKIAHWRQYPGLINALRRIIYEYQPDVIHAGPIQRVAFIAACTGFHPLISMSWGSDLLVQADSNVFWKWITRATLKRTDILITDCQAVTEKARRFGFQKKKIVQFPWGVDLKTFAPGSGTKKRKELGWKDNIILFCNRTWETMYGVEDVVRAFLLAIRKDSRLRLVLAGTGPLKTMIHNMITGQACCDYVFFPGKIDQHKLADYYRAADFYISASHSDGSSVSLMEAMACACPVIVSNIPGNLEWVADGKNGWLFPPGQPEILASVIEKAVNRKESKKFGKVNREIAEQKADWNTNSKQLFFAYDMAHKSHIGRKHA